MKQSLTAVAQTVANTCGRLWTQTQLLANTALRPDLKVKREPSLAFGENPWKHPKKQSDNLQKNGPNVGKQCSGPEYSNAFFRHTFGCSKESQSEGGWEKPTTPCPVESASCQRQVQRNRHRGVALADAFSKSGKARTMGWTFFLGLPNCFPDGHGGAEDG